MRRDELIKLIQDEKRVSLDHLRALWSDLHRDIKGFPKPNRQRDTVNTRRLLLEAAQALPEDFVWHDEEEERVAEEEAEEIGVPEVAAEPVIVITAEDTEAAEAARPEVVITPEEVAETEEVAPVEPARVEHRRPERPEAGPEAAAEREADRLDYMRPAAPAPVRRRSPLRPSWIGVAGVALAVVLCLMAILGTYLLAPNLTGALPQATATTIVEPATETEPGLGEVVEGLAQIDGRLDNIDARLAQLEAGTGASPPGEVTFIPEGVGPAEGTGCRENLWFNEALRDTQDVATLIAALDRDFTLNDGGEWSEPGYTVPAGSVFWTDLFENRSSLPAGVSAVRTQGGWGVYYTSVGYIVPVPNGGGRWMRLCAVFTTEAPEAVPPEETTSEAAPACQLPNLEDLTVAQAINTMDLWFEEEGYQFGSEFAIGDTLPSGATFWTNLGEGYVTPSHITPIRAEGNWGVFMTTQTFEAPSGGRYVSCNSS